MDAGAGPQREGGPGAHLLPPARCAVPAGEWMGGWGLFAGCMLLAYTATPPACQAGACPPPDHASRSPLLSRPLPTPPSPPHRRTTAESAVGGRRRGSCCGSGVSAQGGGHPDAGSPPGRICGLPAGQGRPAGQHLLQLHGWVAPQSVVSTTETTESGPRCRLHKSGCMRWSYSILIPTPPSS